MIRVGKFTLFSVHASLLRSSTLPLGNAFLSSGAEKFLCSALGIRGRLADQIYGSCFSKVFQRIQASSRAFLFASFAFGISPSRMKP